MGLIGLLFAPVAPLVSLAAAIHFWLCSWIYKYQIMFKYVTRVETGGVRSFQRKSIVSLTDRHFQRAWNVVINRLLFSGIFMQVVVVISVFQLSSMGSSSDPPFARSNWSPSSIQIPEIPCKYSAHSIHSRLQTLSQQVFRERVQLLHTPSY